jgi:hypothetical protein
MKGTLQKRVMASHLLCHSCSSFRDDDPDIYYCEHHREEFPGLCDEFQSKARVELENVDVITRSLRSAAT